MKFLRRLRDRRAAVPLIFASTCLDLITTYLLLSFFPNQAVEMNPLINFLIKQAGVGVALFVVMPLVYALGLSIIYRLWEVRLFRWFGYIVLITRAAVVGWHIHLFYVLSTF